MEILSGAPLHPMLVHFPIALFISAFFLEALSLILKKDDLHRTAMHIYVLAALLAPLAVLSGLKEAEKYHLLSHPILNLHRTFALLTMWGSLATLPVLWFLAKIKHPIYRMAFLIFSLLAVISVSVAAYNGGRMVYEYGIGIENE